MLTIPSLSIRPDRRLPIRPRRPRLNIKMHRARRTILIIITRTPTPVIPTIKTSIHNLQRNRRPAPDAIIIRIEAARRQLIALTAGAPAVRLAGAVQAALEELLVDGAVVDARAARPLPGVFAAVAGAALEAVVLRRTEK